MNEEKSHHVAVIIPHMIMYLRRYHMTYIMRNQLPQIPSKTRGQGMNPRVAVTRAGSTPVVSRQVLSLAHFVANFIAHGK